jgi:hypothetical protein
MDFGIERSVKKSKDESKIEDGRWRMAGKGELKKAKAKDSGGAAELCERGKTFAEAVPGY